MSTPSPSKESFPLAFDNIYTIEPSSTSSIPNLMEISLSYSVAATGGSTTLFPRVGSASSSEVSAKPTFTAPRGQTSVTASVPSGDDIATVASQVATADITTSTKLSFCLVTSLAFLKSLTWELTPWAPHYISKEVAEDAEAELLKEDVNPMSRADAIAIQYHLHRQLHGVSPGAIHNGLFFASAYPSDNVPAGPIGTYPHLFVVFPHARTHVATNARFLRIWHDQIVKPAFDRAWKDSGLATTYGAEIDGTTRILQPTGVRTANDAPSCTGILVRLAEHKLESVRCYWPRWSESKSDRRVQVMTEAWDAIQGILKDHPDLLEFQNPILLAVSRGQQDFSTQISQREMFNDVAVEWDKYVDARYLVPDTFRVLLEMAGTFDLGVAVAAGEDNYEDFMMTPMSNVEEGGTPNAPEPTASGLASKKDMGRKRPAKDDGDGDSDRNKRRKGMHTPIVENDPEDVDIVHEPPIRKALGNGHTDNV